MFVCGGASGLMGLATLPLMQGAGSEGQGVHGTRKEETISRGDLMALGRLGPCRGLPRTIESRGWEGPQASSCQQALSCNGQLWKGGEDGKLASVIFGLSFHMLNLLEAELASKFT